MPGDYVPGAEFEDPDFGLQQGDPYAPPTTPSYLPQTPPMGPPQTPPMQPVSPQYMPPVSPQYMPPLSPQYMPPTTPPLGPTTPPLGPTTPPYAPTTPPMAPFTPPVQQLDLPPLQPVSISVPAQNLARNPDGSGKANELTLDGKKKVSFDNVNKKSDDGEKKHFYLILTKRTLIKKSNLINL